MREPVPIRHSQRIRRKRASIVRRPWFWVLASVLLIAVAMPTWIGVRALLAKSELEAAQSLAGDLTAQAAALDMKGATATFGKIADHTKSARGLTSDPVWRLGELVPKLGPNLTVVRELAAVTDDLMLDVAAPLLRVAENVDPSSLAPKDGAIDVSLITGAVPTVLDAKAGVDAATSAIGGIDTAGTVAQLAAAKDTLAGLVAQIAPITDTLAEVLPLVGPALGSDGLRNYVVMFQNNAESRALGGTALSFARITADQGKIELAEIRAAGFANFTIHSESIVPVPDGVLDLYQGTYGTFIPNATVRPSFTSAAEVVQANWLEEFGYEVDAIISIDPVALGYILRASAPITLSTGDMLTSDSLVPLLLNDVYARFNSGNVGVDNVAQDVVYAEAVGATFTALSSGQLDFPLFLAALSQGWEERRVLYSTSEPGEQAQLAKYGLNGEIPRSDEKTERVGVYFQDNVGSKLNYYLNQAVRLSTATCREDQRPNYRVNVDLTSTLPQADVKALSPSIAGNYLAEGLEKGVQRMIVMLYAPPGAQIIGASVDGLPVELEMLHDTDFPVAKVIVSVLPGTASTVTYDFVPEAAGVKGFEAQVTPMVHPTPITTETLDCTTVATQ
ncbi:DUF4012 domain-containing protein [Marisediminicola antarctica]|uniref:DUF4012 domain-containing protein n=1 Tax=Marisediminicola antarctica TaxID=674079 RepID=A0A7L5AFQ8_9MICO|nr:DUF4012 domain-containing protein [Marisediminicola antarctica]QHO68812.1 hypothetical protein BHD05_03315 [Marisediminicola antarctica]